MGKVQKVRKVVRKETGDGGQESRVIMEVNQVRWECEVVRVRKAEKMTGRTSSRKLGEVGQADGGRECGECKQEK